MAVDVFYPATVPLPLKQGYVLKPQPNLLRTEVEQGAKRARRVGRQKPTEVSVVWELTQWELMLLQAFFEHDADEGAAWFGMTLLTYVGLAMCEVRFKGDIQQPKQAGILWQVGATLEVREIPRLSSADFAVLVNEPPDALFAIVVTFHDTVLWQLWPSDDDLYLIFGEDMAYLLTQCAAFHTTMTNLWPD